jgi:hypothetical protein
VFAQSCMAAVSNASDHAGHAEHAGHSGHGAMPCCEQSGGCGDGACFEHACPGMQSADRQTPPALTEIGLQPLPEPVAILADGPPWVPAVVLLRRFEPSPLARPGDHPAQRFQRLRI